MWLALATLLLTGTAVLAQSPDEGEVLELEGFENVARDESRDPLMDELQNMSGEELEKAILNSYEEPGITAPDTPASEPVPNPEPETVPVSPQPVPSVPTTLEPPPTEAPPVATPLAPDSAPAIPDATPPAPATGDITEPDVPVDNSVPEAPPEPTTAAILPEPRNARDSAAMSVVDNWQAGSLMFDPATAQRLNIFYWLYRSKGLGRDLSSGEQPVESGPAAADLPLIYVGSILYHSPRQWSVWVNGVLYSPSRTDSIPTVSVEQISRNQVTLRWQPVTPIEAESTTGLVRKTGSAYLVTLKANQTFVPSVLKISEGRAVTPDIKALLETHTGAGPTIDEQMQQIEQTPVPDGEGTMHQMMNDYQNKQPQE